MGCGVVVNRCLLSEAGLSACSVTDGERYSYFPAGVEKAVALQLILGRESSRAAVLIRGVRLSSAQQIKFYEETEKKTSATVYSHNSGEGVEVICNSKGKGTGGSAVEPRDSKTYPI